MSEVRIGERRCGKEALDLVYWPGREQPLPMCAEHAELARWISAAMGFGLSIQATMVPLTCGSIVKDEAHG